MPIVATLEDRVLARVRTYGNEDCIEFYPEDRYSFGDSFLLSLDPSERGDYFDDYMAAVLRLHDERMYICDALILNLAKGGSACRS